MKNPTPYIGLFLISFALYANERTHAKAPVTLVTPETAEEGLPPEKQSPTFLLRHFYERLQDDSSLKLDQDGVKLSRDSRSIRIRFTGDDAFSDGEISMRESWYTTLERLGELIQQEVDRGMHVQVRGFADLASDNERLNTGSGRSEFAFSYARAEWLARFIESKNRLSLRQHFEITGAGAIEKGRSVELEFTYPRPLHPE